MDNLRLFSTETEYNTSKSGFEYPTVSYVESNDTVYYMTLRDKYTKEYLTFEAIDDCVFTFTMDAKLPTSCVPSISYSVDNGENWTTTANVNDTEVVVTTPTVTSGNKVLWKSNAVQYCYQPDSANVGDDMPLTNAGFGKFKSTGKYNISGNIMSLLYNDSFADKTSFKAYVSTGYGAGAFTYLFGWNYAWEEYEDGPEYFNEKIISSKNLILPATTLANYCYYGMFIACNKMVDCPELPALNLGVACYKEMFYLCDSLLEPPVLPATTLTTECYREMLDRCRHMLYAPELPAMEMKDWCYYGMFSCDTFTTAPELPATTVAPHCYHAMFYMQPNLTTAPTVLPATTLAEYCYGGMFNECVSLVNVPELPATTLANWCYYAMFMGCTSLETTPELPATTMVTNCYRRMFENCLALTTAPELPATTLVSACYTQMFKGCSHLNYIKAMFTTTPSNTYTKDWVSGVASTGTFVKNASATWTTTGINAVPTGWTVQTASA